MTRLHLLLLMVINALWGFNFVAGKVGTATFGPLSFITLRFTIAFVLLAVFLRWVPGQMRRIAAIGLCLGVGHYGFMFYGIHLAGSLSSVAIASQLTVPFVTILAIGFLGERVGAMRVGAIAISFAGVALIGFEPVGPDHLIALLFTAIASAAMAIATILMRQLNGVAVFNLQAWIALCAMISMGIVTLIVEPPDLQHLGSIPLRDYWTAAYSAIAATIIGHGLLYYLLQRYPINFVAPFISLSTVFAVAFGILFSNDVLTLKIVMGGILTLIGVTVVAIRNAHENAPSGIRVPR